MFSSFLLIGSFIAGIITVFAPCVLPLLPVIIGGSISKSGHANKRRPLLIASSLAVSLLLFTVLLKATTLFIAVPPQTFTIISGAILILLGVTLLFPRIYDEILIRLNLQSKAQQLLGKGTGKGETINAIITGAALGPVFSSCSPVYAYILATILPTSFSVAMFYITAYIIGLSVMLLLIGYLGHRFLSRIKFLANPRGWFIRIIAVLFILMGVLFASGYDKRFQVFLAQYSPFDFDKLSQQFIPSERETNEQVLNVKPYTAPEFTGIEDWINSDPKTLADYKGKVVLVDFWTYSCINCIRTQPYLKAWRETYKDSGFEIIGVHAPEFAFERVPRNVERAAKEAGLTYPIALDNDFKTWNAYENQFWPATYLIDTEGKVRRYHGGEGEYKETEQAIRQLLQEGGLSVPTQTSSDSGGVVPVSEKQTPETYLGTKRAVALGNYQGNPGLSNGTKRFTAAELNRVNSWTLGGEWTVDNEGVTAGSDAVIRFRFAAKEMYVVTANDVEAESIGVTLNGTPISETGSAGSDIKQSKVTVSTAQLYRLVNFKEFNQDAILELNVPAGLKLNVFTFGS